MLSFKKIFYTLKPKQHLAIVLSVSLLMLPVQIQALPSGQRVVAGSASFRQKLNNLNITTSNKAIINYNSFNIGLKEGVRFIQPSMNSVVLNRVIQANPSSILGSLNANGKVFLVNPAGIFFGANSVVNANSFLATTLNISNDDFLSGNYQFQQMKNMVKSYIIQKGSISISPQGFIILASPFISSEGSIMAKAGHVNIGATDNFYIQFDSGGLIRYDYQKNTTTDDKPIVMPKAYADSIMNDVINTDKYNDKLQIVQNGDKIELAGGSGTAMISGKINTDATADAKAGTIEVKAQNNALLLNHAKLQSNAATNGNGGNILIYGDKFAYGDQGATLEARGGTLSGNGGFTELSAKKNVILNGTYIDTSAQNGNIGTFLIDPEDLNITSSTTTNSDYNATADNSITLYKNVSISTNGGDINFIAPIITLDNNSSLLAGTGDITLNATSNTLDLGHTALSKIFIDGATLEGGDINIIATSNAQNIFDSHGGSIPYQVAGTLVGDINTPIAVSVSKTDASVNIGAGSKIEGDNINIQSNANSAASASATFKGAAIGYGEADASAVTTVSSGAKINATGNVDIGSNAIATNSVETDSENSDANKTKVDLTLAYSKTDTTSKTTIQNGALIHTTGDINISALASKNIGTSASAGSYKDGVLGTAVAISDSNSTTSANVGGDIKANKLSVIATINDELLETSSSATTGGDPNSENILDEAKDKIDEAQDFLTNLLSKSTDLINNAKDFLESVQPEAETNSSSSTTSLAISAAFSYSKHSSNTTANIANGATVNITHGIGIKATNSYSAGGISSSAEASVDSDENDTKKRSAAGAINITRLSNTANAYIGKNAIVDAGGNIDIISKLYMPHKIAWGPITKPSDIENYTENMSIHDGLSFTTWAQSTASGTQVGAAGSINFFHMTNDTEAYIDTSSKINQNISNYGLVRLLALTDIQTLNLSGFGSKGSGSSGGKGAIGGSYLDVRYDDTTKAMILNDAEVNASALTVAADSNTKNISLAEAGGSSDKYGIAGTFSYLKINNTTHALIQNAIINTLDGIDNRDYMNDDNPYASGAPQTNLYVKSNDYSKLLNIAGGVIKSKNVGIGVSVSLNDITRDTSSIIDSSTINGHGNSYVDATNDGLISAWSLAGSLSSSSSSGDANSSSSSSDANSSSSLGASSSQTAKNGAGKYGIGISGDASINKISDTTSSKIKDSTLAIRQHILSLNAEDNSTIQSYSGSVALSAPNKKSVGFAGSYSQNTLENNVSALIENSILNSSDLTVQAKNAGEIDAYTASGSGQPNVSGIAIAGSVSINKITNPTTASITSNSEVNASGQVTVGSSDTPTINTIAGSASFGGKAGFGASFAYDDIQDNMQSDITDSNISASGISVSSTQASTINSIAASLGASLKGMAVAVSVTINKINNGIKSLINGTHDDNITTTSDISVFSNDNSKITSRSGEASATGGNASLGASVLYNTITNDIEAYISNVLIDADNGNIGIKASSSKSITAQSAGGTGAGTFAAAGGVLINTIRDNVDAYILNSDVVTKSSIALLALEANFIDTLGGTLVGAGTLGIGGTVAVNTINNTINSYIENSNIKAGGAQGISVKKDDGSSNNESIKGLDILAKGDENLNIKTANLSGGGTAGIGASVSVNNIEDTINSYIDNSYINQVNSSPDVLQSVRVRAVDQDNVNILGGGLAIGGTVGLNGTSDTTLINNTSNAYINASLVKAANLAEVKNAGYTTVNSKIVSGAGAGVLGVAGNVEVININNSNFGYINNSSIFSDGNTSVLASDTTNIGTKRDGTRDGILVGALGIGGVVGIGGSVIVTTTKQNAQAHVDNSSLNAKGATTIASDTNADVKTYAASGALGGYVGAGGAVTVNTIDATSKAYTSTDEVNPMLINQDTSYQNPLQSVAIKANSDSKLDSTPGVLSAGLVGVSGSVDVGTIRNSVLAKVGNGVNLYSGGNLLVQATSNKEANSNVGAFGGGVAGVAGAVSIININNAINSDSIDASKNTEDKTNDVVGKSQVGDQLGDSQTATDTKTELDAKTTNSNVDSEFSQSALNQSIYAGIGSGSSVHTGGLTDINTTDTFNVQQLTGAGAGGIIGVGGAVSIANIGANDKATIGTGANINDGNLTINSRLNTIGSNIQSDAAGAGVVGLGAAVSLYNLNYENDAYIGSNTNINNVNNVNIIANTSTDVNAKAYGAEAGAAAIGVTVARAYETGTTQAYLDSGAQVANVNNLTINAASTDTVRSNSKAAAGGIYSGTGTDAKATVNPTVKAYINDNANIDVENNISIQAIATIASYADAEGVAIGGIGVGLSLAKAIVEPIVNAYTGSDVNISAKNLWLLSTLNPKDNQKMAESKAIASAGALVAGQVSKAESDITPEVKAWFGSNNTLKADDDLKLIAFSDASGSSKTSGISAGMLALGGDESFTSINSTTTATVGSDANTNVGGLFQINANSNHNLWSETKAGAGGLGAVVAAKAETDSTGKTQVKIDDSDSNSTIKADSVKMTAEHHSKFDGKADSSSASVVGGSGAWLDHNTNSNTEVNIGKSVRIDAPTGIQISALNDITKPASNWSVKAGAGGVAAGAAAVSNSNINNTAKVIINDNASLVSQIKGRNDGDIDISTSNKVYDHGLVKLDAGGAISGGDVKSLITNKTNTAEVDIDPWVSFIADGNISIGSRASINVDAESRAKTYGLASASAGTSNATVNVNNKVNIDNNVDMLAGGNIYLSAGYDNFHFAGISASTDTRLWNKSILPMTSANAITNVTQSNLVTVGSGSNIGSVHDIYITSTKGGISTSAYGVSKNLYNEILNWAKGILENDSVSEYKNSGEVDESSSGAVNINGTLDSGIHYHQFLTVDRDGNIVPQNEGEGIQATITPDQNVTKKINDEINALEEHAAEYADLPDVSQSYTDEADILRQQLNNPIYHNYTVPFIDVDPVIASAGNVHITSDYLNGLGSIKAPGDAKIDIINNSPYFLFLSSLTISDKEGGRILFNNVPVTTNDDINKINTFGSPAKFTHLVTSNNSPEPQISVVNIFKRSGNLLPPQMNFQGDVSNPGGGLNINSTGSVIVSANMNAETINIKTDGDFIQGYTKGFSYIGGAANDWLDPVARDSDKKGMDALTQQGNSNYTRGIDTLAEIENDYNLSKLGSIIAGQNVFISAEKLDINGLIQSGLPDRKVTINNTMVDGVQNDKDDYASKLSSGINPNPRYPLNTPGAGSPEIQVYYNAKTDRLELEPISVLGGYMELVGDIFSTSDNGKLKVLDGYGRINVDNQTNYPLEIKRLDTGGSKVQGMIKIIDTSRRIVNNSIMTVPEAKDKVANVKKDTQPLITIYRHLNGNVTEYNNLSVDDNGKPNHLVSTTPGRLSDFNTTQGRRYDWITGQEVTVEDDYISYVDTDTFFGADIGKLGTLFANNNGGTYVSDNNYTLNGTPILKGTTLRFDNNSNYYTYNFKKVGHNDRTLFGTTYPSRECIETDCGPLGKVCWCAKYRNYRKQIYHKGETEYNHHSINASFPINIDFSGYDEGNVSVKSGGDIYVSGLLRASNLAKVTSSQGNILENQNIGKISAKTIQLSSPQGGIGTMQRPLNTNLLQNGTLNASAKNSIFINEPVGQMKIGEATSSVGDVNLSSDSDMITTPNTVINGDKISLESRYGSIGSSDNILNINSNGTVDAKAAGDIWLNETDGDLGIDQVHSYGGDVSISVADGNLLDDNPEEVRDPKKEAGLLSSIWENNRLQGADANASRDDNLANIYERYWREKRNLHLDENSSVVYDNYDPNVTFAFTDDQKNDLRDSGWSDDQITHQENVMTGVYREIGKNAYSSNYRSYNTDKTIDNLAADSAFSDLVRGYKWTNDELDIGISATLFKPTTNTRVRVEDPNIIAHNVTLNVNGQVGTTKGDIVIWRHATPQPLTRDEKLALAAAERNDLNITNNSIVIARNDDFNIATSGITNIKATGDLFLGSQKNINIEQADGKQVRIKTRQGIYGETNSSVHLKSQNDLILEAAEGGIGTSDTPIITDIASGYDLTARAKKNIFITENQGNMSIQSIFSENNVSLTSTNGAITQGRYGGDTTNIQSNKLILHAKNGIGDDGVNEKPLNLAVNTLDAYNEDATNDIALKSSKDLSLQDFNHDGYVLYNGGGATTVSGNGILNQPSGSVVIYHGGGGIKLSVDGDLDQQSGTSIFANDSINMKTLGDIIASNIESNNSITMDTTNGNMQFNHIEAPNAVSLTSMNGAITQNGDSATNIQSDKLILHAKNGIGDDGVHEKYLNLAVNNLDAYNESANDIALKNNKDLSLPDLNLDGYALYNGGGAIKLPVNGALKQRSGTSIFAKGNIDMQTVGDISAFNLISDHNITMNTANGNMQFQYIETPHTVSLTSKNGTITQGRYADNAINVKSDKLILHAKNGIGDDGVNKISLNLSGIGYNGISAKSLNLSGIGYNGISAKFLNLDVNTIDAYNESTNNIVLENIKDLSLQDLDHDGYILHNGGGAIKLLVNGALKQPSGTSIFAKGNINMQTVGDISASNIKSDHNITMGTANGNMQFNHIEAPNTVSLISTNGSITQNGDSATNIKSDKLILIAKNGIGDDGVHEKPLNLAVNTLDTYNVSANDIALKNSKDLTLQYLNHASYFLYNGGGAIKLLVNGTLTQPSGANIFANGDIDIQTVGDILAFYMKSNHNIMLNTTNGSILGDPAISPNLVSNQLELSAANSIGSSKTPLSIKTMLINKVQSKNGDIYLQSKGNMKLNSIQASKTVSLNSQNGAITQNGDSATNIQSDKLILHAKNGIGDDGAHEKYLDLAVNILDAYNESKNDIALKNSKDLTLQDLNHDGYFLYNGGGAIKLLVNGALNQPSGTNIFANGDIDMQTAGNIFASNIKSNHNITLRTTNGSILGDPAINPNIAVQGKLTLSADNGFVGTHANPLNIRKGTGGVYIKANVANYFLSVYVNFVTSPTNYFVNQDLAAFNNRVISGSLIEEYYRSLFPVYKNNLFLLRSLFMKYEKIKKELPSDLINLSFLKGQ